MQAGLTISFDRTKAESYLGLDYAPRLYSYHGSVAKGSVDIKIEGATVVCSAYSLNGGKYAVGMLINKAAHSFSLVLADRSKRLCQAEISEAVDFWESTNSNYIYSLFEKSCGAVVYTDDEGERKFLLIRMNLGHCGLPKGHMEKFETEESTAIREIHEETGVDVQLIDGFRKTVEYQISPRARKESVYFVGHFSGDKVVIQESEIKDYLLAPYEEARNYITHDNDRIIFDEAVKWLNDNNRL